MKRLIMLRFGRFEFQNKEIVHPLEVFFHATRFTFHVFFQALETAVDLGLTKAIGLSNFNIQQIQHILANCRIKPANLQVIPVCRS